MKQSVLTVYIKLKIRLFLIHLKSKIIVLTEELIHNPNDTEQLMLRQILENQREQRSFQFHKWDILVDKRKNQYSQPYFGKELDKRHLIFSQ